MKATIIETREVEVPKDEAYRLAIEVIQEACDLRGATRIENENLCYSERVGGGSQSWIETVVVRPATDADKKALDVIARIKRKLNEKTK